LRPDEAAPNSGYTNKQATKSGRNRSSHLLTRHRLRQQLRKKLQTIEIFTTRALGLVGILSQSRLVASAFRKTLSRPMNIGLSQFSIDFRTLY
jgi:hypothetical protein